MKKLFAFMLAVCLIAGLCACNGVSDDEIKAIRNVIFEGTELTVTLGTNKSTGYEWDYDIYGECIKASINRSFKVTGSKGDATGEVSIGFEGLSEGSATIVFTTPNGWDGTGKGDGYTVKVEVASDGKIVSAVGSEGANAPKTAVTIAELAEGTYTGTLSGSEFVNDEKTIFTTLMPADITVTIENGQLTFFGESASTAYGVLNGVKTPQSPDASIIFSGSLPLQQSGDAVTADGELTSSGKSVRLHHVDFEFESWELTERSGSGKYACTAKIVMTDGLPVANISIDMKGQLTLTADVTLALK